MGAPASPFDFEMALGNQAAADLPLIVQTPYLLVCCLKMGGAAAIEGAIGDILDNGADPQRVEKVRREFEIPHPARKETSADVIIPVTGVDPWAGGLTGQCIY